MSPSPARFRIHPLFTGVAGLVLGLAGGYFWKAGVSDSSETRTVSLATVSPASPVTAAGSPLAAGTPDGTDALMQDLLSKDDEVRRKALTRGATEALNCRKPAERMRRFLAVLAHCRPGDSGAVHESFHIQDQQGRLFYEEFKLFMDFLGRTDGLAEMERNKRHYSSPGVNVLEHHVMAMTAWAETEPDAAIKWWNDLEDGKLRDGMSRAIISGVLKKDMPRAVEYLKAFPEPERSQHAGAFMRECLQQGGPGRAVEWLQTVDLPSGEGSPFHVRAVQSLMTSMVNIPVAEKAAFVETLLDKQWFAEGGNLGRLMGEWGKKDPAKAGAWLAAHSSAPGFNGAAATLTAEWSKVNPQAAEEWRKLAVPQNQ